MRWVNVVDYPDPSDALTPTLADCDLVTGTEGTATVLGVGADALCQRTQTRWVHQQQQVWHGGRQKFVGTEPITPAL
ncbi:MAG: hypothetical protein AB8B85_06730 [Paracoccaceae bacterium]